MNDTRWSAVTDDAVGLLLEIARDGAPPDDARRRLQPLTAKHPEHRIRLVWEREDYARAWHYDAIVERPGEGALVIGYCPDRGLPFIARAATRWDEDDLLRVNGETVKIQGALEYLEIAHNPALCARLVNGMLITQALAELPAEATAVTGEELQRAMDAFRAREGLRRAEDTLRWLRERGLSHESFEAEMEAEVRSEKLREVTVGPAIDAHFEARRADLAEACVTTLRVRDAAEASRLHARLTEGQDLLGALESCAPGAAPEVSLLRVAQRRELPAEVGDAAFAAPIGRWIGPLSTASGALLLRVSSRRDATLDAALRARLRDELFDAWLEARREAARVEWFWGRAT